ncbi:MFS transporter [Microthyrium microscopicum]|uniref:MFS transporter n=1 Tax=Microthyrium microscopicum TaxID=703497 RepID=A0A6A6TWU2_9PEZI|nr:MFS transporter [Microthyrium microscopicum]
MSSKKQERHRIERHTVPTAKLPTTQLTILSICRFAEPVALTGVFPYLPEMIESFNIPHNEVAKWAGIISAVFSIAQCLTAIPWGRASDKYGRKPIIMLAMFCAMSSSLMFGFSTSLAWCIVARAFSGASNGNVGILRTVVAEMVPQKALQPRAFATLPLVWQIGSILGPILGGALASPATNFPEIFGGSRFFKTFPYALPNLLNGVIFTFGIVSGILFLHESLASKRHQRDYGRQLGAKLVGLFAKKNRKDSLRPADDFESNIPKTYKAEKARVPSYREVFAGQSNLMLFAYFILALHATAYDQLLSVFMHLPVQREGVELPFRFNGGFGLESGRIGIIFSIFGIFSMICQFTIFPKVTLKYGPLKCFRVCTIFFPIFYMITPFTVLMPTPLMQQGAILAVALLRAMSGVFAFPCITILLTNSAKDLALLGTLNGVATSLAAVGRACGPYFAGRAFTWGVDNNWMISPWWLMALFAVPGHVASYWLVEGEGFGNTAQEEDEMRETIPMDPRRTVSQAGLQVDNFILADSDDSEDEDDSPSADKPLLRASS